MGFAIIYALFDVSTRVRLRLRNGAVQGGGPGGLCWRANRHQRYCTLGHDEPVTEHSGFAEPDEGRRKIALSFLLLTVVRVSVYFFGTAAVLVRTYTTLAKNRQKGW